MTWQALSVGVVCVFFCSLEGGAGFSHTKMASFSQHASVASAYSSLTEIQIAALAGLPSELAKIGVSDAVVASLSREERCSFLKVRKWVASDAAAQIKDATAWLEDLGVVTMEHVAPFMRTPSGRTKTAGFPDGCVVLLEDGRGGCARDSTGRPVAVSMGMSHGSAREMQLQLAYTMQRARLYALPGQSPGDTCTVIEVAPRDPAQKNTPTFRFPDVDVRSLFDLQTRVYPSSLGTSTHFCGLPQAVVWAFRLCKPFMSAETYDNMKLKPDFSHLADKHIPPDSMLPRWSSGGNGGVVGSFEFDIDEYVEWRAREENVPAGSLCPRGQGRAFAASSAESALDSVGNDGTGASSRISAAELLGVSKAAPSDGVDGGGDGDATQEVSKAGVVSKQGSGRGLFGNHKWKEKLLVVRAGAALYFDSTDATSATNFVARVIPLGSGCRVSRASEGPASSGFLQRFGVPAAVFVLATPARDYTFSVGSEKEAAEWEASLAKEIKAAEEVAMAGTSHQADSEAALRVP